MKCCVCARERAKESMTRITLTDEERAFVLKFRGVNVTEYWYCKPCMSILSDKRQGAELIKGALQVQLQARGIRNAEKIAQKVYDKLIEKAAKGPVS